MRPANSFMLSASPLLHLVALQYIVHAPNHTYIYIPSCIYCTVIGDTLQQWHCFKLLENLIEKVLSQTLGVGYDTVFDLQLELLHSIVPVLHPHMHQHRIITPHRATLGQQHPRTHPPSNVILELHHMQYADRGEEHLIECGSGQSGASLSISLAIVRGMDDNDNGLCSFSLLCLHLCVSLLLSCSGGDGDGDDGDDNSDAACDLVTSCTSWSAARSASRCARVYSRMQRWLYGWHTALAGELSSRIVVVAE